MKWKSLPTGSHPIVYASEATPVACPRKLHQPMIHAQIATCWSGTTCFVTKYIPPAVGYAETNSATQLAMTMAMNDPMNHVQTAVAGPPTLMGTPYVAGCDPRTPRIDIAYETVDHLVNSRRNSCERSALCGVGDGNRHKPVCTRCARGASRRRPVSWPWRGVVGPQPVPSRPAPRTQSAERSMAGASRKSRERFLCPCCW